MNTCPNCKLINPSDAVRCDCGYDFTSGKLERSYDEKLARYANDPLTFWESVFTALYGAGLGLLGLIFVWPQASRFRSAGYILKAKKSWRLYWFAFGIRLAAVVILVIIAVATSH
jgi:hypothetical protein